MDLHLVKTDSGFAIVTRRPGPYSVSPEIEDVVLTLTHADMDRLEADMRALEPPPVVADPVPVPQPPQENQ